MKPTGTHPLPRYCHITILKRIRFGFVCYCVSTNEKGGFCHRPSQPSFFWELSGNHLKDALQLFLQDALGNCPDDLLNRATVPED